MYSDMVLRFGPDCGNIEWILATLSEIDSSFDSRHLVFSISDNLNRDVADLLFSPDSKHSGSVEEYRQLLRRSLLLVQKMVTSVMSYLPAASQKLYISEGFDDHFLEVLLEQESILSFVDNDIRDFDMPSVVFRTEFRPG